jgi:hypothetical protein
MFLAKLVYRREMLWCRRFVQHAVHQLDALIADTILRASDDPLNLGGSLPAETAPFVGLRHLPLLSLSPYKCGRAHR